MFGQEAGGEELWLCYICLKNNQAVFVEDEQDQLVIGKNHALKKVVQFHKIFVYNKNNE